MIPAVTPNERRVSVAFTGYRPSKLPYLNDLNSSEAGALYQAIYDEFERLVFRDYRFFLTGGALGCDLLAAEAVVTLKKKYYKKHIVHELCIPCYDHDAKWDEKDKRRLEEIKKSSIVTYVTDSGYVNGCMQKRNRYMVDTSSVLVAVYDGINGGTKNTVEYAQKQNKKLIVIRPREMVRMQFIDAVEDIEQLMLLDESGDWE
ncbi:MAG: SLOG family protein [Ruminiclostridium sp.]|nr:SLOG family protein [Ruminiclostridium sp.]